MFKEHLCGSIFVGSAALSSKLFDFVAIKLQETVVAPFEQVLYKSVHVLQESRKTGI